jgi:hypothetical protein
MKLLIQQRCIWLSGVGFIFFVMVCGYELPNELAYLMCVYVQIKHSNVSRD